MPLTARRSGWKHHAALVVVYFLFLLWIGLMGVRALFPIGFRSEIVYWSGLHDLDPAWVAAVIRNESRFDPDAVSPSGAIGLMQIMPETGHWIAAQLSQNGFSSESLRDVDTNLELGTWYLKSLLNRFSSPDEALAAYNAGPAYAALWGGDPRRAFPETRHYIQRVRLSLPVYRVYFRVPWLLNVIPSLDFSH